MNRCSRRSFYVTGGTLRPTRPPTSSARPTTSSTTRLSRGEFCYVLTSRQMGKSSLMVRTAARLREEGVAVAVLDLTALGQNLTAEQWYDGLLGRLGQPPRPGRRAGRRSGWSTSASARSSAGWRRCGRWCCRS